MGAYLSEPKVEKFSSDQVGKFVSYGASSMQGWRVSQEDAHNCCISFDDGVSLFAVYDGHGGSEVAEYCAQNLPDFIKNTEAYKNGDMIKALIDAFLGFDATLATPEVMQVLKELTMKDGGGSQELSDDEENVNSLYQEAQMPLDQVMQKYTKMMAKNEDSGETSSEPWSSDKAGTSGCSTSSSSSVWNTNETDVSSSSQHCGSSLSSTSNSNNTTSIKSSSECSVSSESDNALDSTTGNGDIVHDSAEKNEDMPDSSGDAKNCISANKKEDTKDEKVTEKNGESVDSSKSITDSVSSSSSSHVENGNVSKEQTVLVGKRKRINFVAAIDDDDEDDDEDDENDENFRVEKPDSDFDDDDDTEEVEEEDSDSSDSILGMDDEDEDEDDEYGDLDEEDDALYENFRSDEPGVGSGCTAVVAILKNNDLYVANAGDSRCVLSRNGVAIELSLDHKPEDKIEMDRIVNAGGRVTADGRVNGGLNLSRAIGDHSYKRNTSLPPQEQMISALPDVRHIAIDPKEDEFMILACDGIWNFMSSQGVVDFVRERLDKNSENLSKICEELFDFCLAPNTLGDGTGCDNMTAVIVKFQHPKCVGNAQKRPAPVDENTTNDDVTSEEQKRQKLDEKV